MRTLALLGGAALTLREDVFRLLEIALAPLKKPGRMTQRRLLPMGRILLRAICRNAVRAGR